MEMSIKKKACGSPGLDYVFVRTSATVDSSAAPSKAVVQR